MDKRIDGQHIFASSGMASIYKALRSARRYQLNKNYTKHKVDHPLYFGFPYLDTLKCYLQPQEIWGEWSFRQGRCKDLAEWNDVLAGHLIIARRVVLFTEVPQILANAS
jgi:hypothetical protein